MTVFEITHPRTPRRVDAALIFNLPQVRCHDCGETWGQNFYRFPAFKSDFLNKKDFNFDRVVTVNEFEQLRDRLSKAAGRPVPVYPGAAIGELCGDAGSPNLGDFEWGTIPMPLISKKARDILESEGIRLVTAECTIKYRHSQEKAERPFENAGRERVRPTLGGGGRHFGAAPQQPGAGNLGQVQFCLRFGVSAQPAATGGDQQAGFADEMRRATPPTAGPGDRSSGRDASRAQSRQSRRRKSQKMNAHELGTESSRSPRKDV